MKKEVPRIIEERKSVGLQGLVGGLECIVINTEPQQWGHAIQELMQNTGATVQESFQTPERTVCVLSQPNSADILIQQRTEPTEKNPFTRFNQYPKSKHLPNTRLETYVYTTKDLEAYVDIQKNRGVQFLTDKIEHTDSYSFIQTIPSPYTGNSIGFIQWHAEKKTYIPTIKADSIDAIKKPPSTYLKNIQRIDHAATRVKAEHRDQAIIEFMELTNYTFDFAIYVKMFNSITNVARVSEKDFAMVFTSGVTPFISLDVSGPTEKFIYNYGPRTHHIAFQTEHIEDTYQSLKERGTEFLIDLVGSPEEGLKQTFTVQSKNTLLVNEYIRRYGDFDGFFTKSNVTLLTESTDKQ
ncbi:MAG: hypothetical protein JW771_03515 [Candidatus Thermoplasmatota archaeon]|nr:hypothetical protein [Candidatus Thermoplasmatota archaeon]